MRVWHESAEELPRPLLVTLALVMVGAVSFVGYQTGWQLRLSFLFLIPISLTSWFVGRWGGVAVSIASAFGWLLTIRESGHTFSSEAFLYWNSLLLLGVFLVFGWLLSALRLAHAREQNLARTDSLTTIANRRAFFELAELEIQRAARHERPLAIAYIDLDNFKVVNDSRGHEDGDRLLVLIATTIRKGIRATDIVARLGGDEFCVLLPEAGPEEAAAAIRNLQLHLSAARLREDWNLTLSIGAVAFRSPPESPASMVRLADELMYSIKSGGGNRFELRVVDDQGPFLP